MTNNNNDGFHVVSADGVSIYTDATLSDAVILLAASNIGLLVVTDRSKEVFGVFTDGDLRRNLLKSTDISTNISEICTTAFIAINEINERKISEIFTQFDISTIPVVRNKKLTTLVCKKKNSLPLNYDAQPVIMAGGKGSRLKPFTKVLPKPLIAYDGEPILDKILHRFFCESFLGVNVLVNYQAEIISAYILNKYHGGQVSIIKEKSMLGTAGGLKLVDTTNKKYLLISNCDILANFSWSKFLKHHIDKQNDLTILGVAKTSKSPYGVLDFDDEGKLIKMLEKPMSYNLINSGIYIIDVRILDLIDDEALGMDTLIERILSNKGNVGIFPTDDVNWIDIGITNDFLKLL